MKNYQAIPIDPEKEDLIISWIEEIEREGAGLELLPDSISENFQENGIELDMESKRRLAERIEILIYYPAYNAITDLVPDFFTHKKGREN